MVRRTASGGSDGATVAPARETTADVIVPSPRSSESFLRSDHTKTPPIAATMVAMITGANSRRSSLAGILLALLVIPGHLFTGIGFEVINEVVLRYG